MADCRILAREGEAPELAGRWLFVSPHDDDALIGAGCWLQALGRNAHVLIVTDGSLGFAQPGAAAGIAARRRAEAAAAYAELGLPAENLHRLEYPDGSLSRHTGSVTVQGKLAGLDCDLTRLYRTLRPSRVITTDAADWHPDHRATFESARMALFHACAEIWLELGQPLAQMPSLHSFAVYAPPNGPPAWCLEAGPAFAARKAAALERFTSQQGIIAHVAEHGATEYLWRVPTAPFDPGEYRALFSN
ncbi:MAG: PIG-L family deacetylase [Planctomycetes bacterium]|nr:PIG-L family deacetylase [Planctomycetota bacterium]MCW8135077.1 PIG-L family deacetylase [Planctomycetota bacterium]